MTDNIWLKSRVAVAVQHNNETPRLQSNKQIATSVANVELFMVRKFSIGQGWCCVYD